MGPTLIGLLQESVVKYSSLAALKSRGPDGGFQTITYAELYGAVKELGTGLIAMGFAAGTHAAILAENNPRWLISDLAILGCGGVDVPVSTHMSDRELEHILAHADCELAVVEDAQMLLRLVALRRRLPKLRKIVVMNYAGAKPQAGMGEERVLLYTWDEVMKKGRTRIARGERQFEIGRASCSERV
jgi:long-chain acyl-CoA synthetase